MHFNESLFYLSDKEKEEIKNEIYVNRIEQL